MKAIVAATTIMFAMFNPTQVEQPVLAPDLIMLNAAVRMMDAAQPKAEAIAVRAKHIAAVGTSAELRSLAGPQTRSVDAGGKSVLPGFNDAHVHWLSDGYSITKNEGDADGGGWEGGLA